MSRERERRLEHIRKQALEQGVVDGKGIAPAGAPFPVASPETGYYGAPLLKRPTWTWEIPLYFFTGGAAGASAVLGSVARLCGEDGALVRDARQIAALGGMISAPLLISDLGRPARFLNMLRVFKPQSPMSVGAWTLFLFSSSATLAALFSERRVGDAAGILSAASGLVMATYTGVLIGATAIPVWAQNVSVLPAEFGASALGSAACLLELRGHRGRALNVIGGASAVVETATGAFHETRRALELAPAKKGKAGLLIRAGGVLSGPLALGLRLAGRRGAAAAVTLAGSVLLRYGWLAAGRASADDARPQLRLGGRSHPPPESRISVAPSRESSS